MRIFRTLALATAAGAALSACVHYEPKPVAPERFAAGYDARQLAPLPPGATWSDAALLQAAIANSSAVREAETNYRAARAAAKASRTPPPITLLLIAEYSRDAGGTTPWLYNGMATIPLDYGAKRSAVVHARIQRLAAERETLLAQQAVQLRRDRAQKLELRIRSGEDARPAGITAAVELAAAERRVQDLINLRVQADAALAKALGVPVAAVQPIMLESLPNTVMPPSPQDLAVWRQEASLRRRDVLRAVADYDVAEQGLRLEVAKQYPDVQLGPSYTFERGQHKIPFDLTLVLPPRDLNKANIQSAEAKRALAGAKLDTVQAAVLTGVDQTSAALVGDVAGLDRALNQDLPLARRADTAARKALAAGELDRTDQEAAQAAALDAEITGLDAWRTAWLAVADLEDALRRPTPAESAVLEAAVKRAGEPQ